MSGDYSRWSFDPRRHVGAVLMQQGRVQTDADWNEWASVLLRRLQAGGLDTLGHAAVPRETPDGFRIEAQGGALTIGPGRMHVDGLLVENHGEEPLEWDGRLAELRGTAPTPYDAQPHLPEPPALPGGGPHLAYLKAWQREVTAVEDPALVEVALGVDTTTRLQTVWQVRLIEDVGSEVTCATDIEDVPGFLDAEPPAAGRLTTGTADVAGAPDPCLVPPGGGYTGLENQLYRVEIHSGGDLAGADRATFKWSRDNASVATRVTEIPAPDRIVVESVGRDELLGFSDGDWVEVTDDWRELAGLPGEMRRIQTGGGVDDATLTIRLESPLPAGVFPVDAQGRTTPGRNTRLRRWDQHGRVLDADGDLVVDLDAGAADGTIPVAAGPTRIVLEDGIVVSFSLEPSGGLLRTGDHWVFAARSADASVEVLDAAPPQGVHAHYAKLALVTFPDAETDCRTLWPPEGGGGCDCTVCVTPESHVTGALTIQAAVDRVAESGGTVCLAAGTYPLSAPVEIHDARSVRLRGQGWATVLVGTGSGTALDVRRSLGVTVERLAVLTSSREVPSDAVRIARSADVLVERCLVVDLPAGGEGGAAIALEGAIAGARVEDCVLAAHTGIAGGVRPEAPDPYLATASLRIDSNWMWCARRGVELGRAAIHLAGARISGNTIWGCRDAGLTAVGASAAGPVEVEGNALNVMGAGIVLGLDAARVAGNDVRGGDGDGIALERGLDAGGIDGCQLLANRILEMGGHAVAIRAPVGSGMIKHNVIAGIGGGGVVVEGDGSARRLVVENNQLDDIARRARGAPGYAAALRLLAVGELDVVGNAIGGVARDDAELGLRSGILAIAARSARIEGNRVAGVGPPAGFVGWASGIHVVGPYRSATLSGNRVQRRGSDDDKLGGATWLPALLHDQAFQVGLFIAGVDTRVMPLGDVLVVNLVEVAYVVTPTTLIRVAAPVSGDAAVLGNEVLAEASAAPPLIALGPRGCRIADNRLVNLDGAATPSLVRCGRATVSGNDLRGVGDEEVLSVELEGKGGAAILGNLRTGAILLEGGPLAEPWETLNPFSHD